MVRLLQGLTLVIRKNASLTRRPGKGQMSDSSEKSNPNIFLPSTQAETR